ncbi:nucleoside-diphosphate-sugar epimerase family protein [Mytilinidion resinicola]|uniref:Nucleoside-diphosphate-sugar epimerase family protein n=1 Tax=Mytilinidion resinicola TaxID=574789 RepID=A0A6A6YAR0_9PEZI|nr:nucleoside-diphosphate-sugar epimerase family protein [Mytilinidion resinicola]KAF2805699.1 nucleoside-diphosphate-sugar epimerase family protein [Mytilinidion resinicola]
MKSILIIGATGGRGSAVINALLARNAKFDILAVTRNTSSASAQKLAAKSPNIKLVQGNLNDPEALFKIAESLVDEPIWGVFSVQVSRGKEVAQGNALVDTALKHSVSHFVYSSVDRGGPRSFENPTDIPHFITKHNIEHYLVASTKGTEMNWTILQPAAFMENFGNNFIGKLFAKTWQVYLKEKPLQLVSMIDIGVFAADAFLDPVEYKSKSLPLAGSELTFQQANAIFKKKTGKDLPLTFSFISYVLRSLFKDLGYMFRFFRDEGFGANITELKKMHPGLLDFGTWLDKESKYETNK